MEVTRISFSVVVDGGRRTVEFVRKEKIEDLMHADGETLGSWMRAMVTESADGSLGEWLKHYTWVQPDGTVDFSRPRERPAGLAIDGREVWHEAPDRVLVAPRRQ